MRVRNDKKLIKLILAKSGQICKTSESRTKRRGRPKVYEDYIILSALLLKVLKKLSLRELEEELKDLFPQAPDFTTLWYRFKKLDDKYLKELIEESAREIMEGLRAKEFYCLVADGTGFGIPITENR